MKKIISYLICVAVLLTLATSFSSCGKKSNDEDTNAPDVKTSETTTTEASDVVTDEEVETVYVVVTNTNGERVTDNEGNYVTEAKTVTKKTTKKSNKKSKTTAPTYEVKGGTDPYVEDIF